MHFSAIQASVFINIHPTLSPYPPSPIHFDLEFSEFFESLCLLFRVLEIIFSPRFLKEILGERGDWVKGKEFRTKEDDEDDLPARGEGDVKCRRSLSSERSPQPSPPPSSHSKSHLPQPTKKHKEKKPRRKEKVKRRMNEPSEARLGKIFFFLSPPTIYLATHRTRFVI